MPSIRGTSLKDWVCLRRGQNFFLSVGFVRTPSAAGCDWRGVDTRTSLLVHAFLLHYVRHAFYDDRVSIFG